LPEYKPFSKGLLVLNFRITQAFHSMTVSRPSIHPTDISLSKRKEIKTTYVRSPTKWTPKDISKRQLVIPISIPKKTKFSTSKCVKIMQEDQGKSNSTRTLNYGI
jgi:hypothetical protein